MSRDDGTITEAVLHAYADGRLDEAGRAAVETHLARHPDQAAEIAAWQRQNEALHALYDHIAAEPVPERLEVHRLACNAGDASARWQRMAAAAVVLVAVGGAAGWYGHDLQAPVPRAARPLVDEAMTAHTLYASEIVHPVEVRADQQAHLATWLSKRLDRSLTVPDLRSVGFDLVGGRLLPGDDGPAALFMYEDRAGHRITLYIVPTSDGRESAFRFARYDNLRSFFWTDETIRCALVGDLPRGELHRIALNAYEQLG